MPKPLPVLRRPKAPGDALFIKRILSALILAPLALGLTWWGGHAFSIFVAAFAAAMGWEWVSMSERTAPPRAFALATGTAVGAALLATQAPVGWVVFWIVCGTIGAGFDRKPRGGVGEAVFGVAYIASAVAMLVWLRGHDSYGLDRIIYVFAVVWAADSFAYLVGTWIGGPKLLPQASPNKTWTGFIAGLAFGVLAGALVMRFAGGSLWVGGAIALPVAMSAVIGDLVMSLAKRRFGVKDAGSLIPGHGGVLDRVDALMLAALMAGFLFALNPSLWPGGAPA